MQQSQKCCSSIRRLQQNRPVTTTAGNTPGTCPTQRSPETRYNVSQCAGGFGLELRRFISRYFQNTNQGQGVAPYQRHQLCGTSPSCDLTQPAGVVLMVRTLQQGIGAGRRGGQAPLRDGGLPPVLCFRFSRQITLISSLTVNGKCEERVRVSLDVLRV